VWSCELNRRIVVSAECASTIKWSLAQAEGTGMASRSATAIEAAQSEAEVVAL
jgi:hypothetical protein